MGIWDDARGSARSLSLALVLGLTGLPMAVAGQPEPGEPSIFSTPASSVFAHFRLRLSGWQAEPFALRRAPEPTHLLAEKWRDAAQRIAADADILARCRSAAIECPRGAQDLLDIIDDRARRTRVSPASATPTAPSTSPSATSAMPIGMGARMHGARPWRPSRPGKAIARITPSQNTWSCGKPGSRRRTSASSSCAT